MNMLKREEYSRSLPNSRWLRNMLENYNEDFEYAGKEFEYGVTISKKLLEQSVRVVEGKPIYLTEEQWDWLYDEILYMKRNLFFGLDYLCNQGVAEEEKESAFHDWNKSLNYYTTLFEKDIDSFLETLPFETFICAGCNKELEQKHMRLCIWSKNDQSDEMARLIVSQKGRCMSLLSKEIHWLKTDKPDDGWFLYAFGNCDDEGEPKNPLPWDREKILMLLRNAYRKLDKTPLGYPVFLDPYTAGIFYAMLDAHQYFTKEGSEYEDIHVTQIMKMLENAAPEIKKNQLCGSCAGEGICYFCDGELSEPPREKK